MFRNNIDIKLENVTVRRVEKATENPCGTGCTTDGPRAKHGPGPLVTTPDRQVICSLATS